MQKQIGGIARLYVLLVNGCPPSGVQPLPQPTSTNPGEWFTIPSELEITHDPTALWQTRAKLYLVEIDPQDDTRARLVSLITAKQMETLNIFVSGCHSITSGSAAVSGTAKLEAEGDVTVYASGSSNTVAKGKAVVHASESATGRLYGKSTLNARGQSSFALFDESSGRASEQARITGRGYCKIDASGESHVDVFDFCQVFGEGTPVIRGYNRSKIWASNLSKVKTFDESKAWVRDNVRATADGSSQIFAAPGVSVRPLNFAGVAQLQVWPDLASLTN